MIIGLRVCALTAALAGGCPAPEGQHVGDPSGGGPDGAAQDELIVFVNPGADSQTISDLYAQIGATLLDRIEALSADLVRFDPEQRDRVQDALSDSPLVDGLATNRQLAPGPLPEDPLYEIQWHLAAIELPAAWQTTRGSDAILVAVLDTGVDQTHPDLAPKLRQGANTFDGVSGWQDTRGHGTEVAGVLGALADNQTGVASVAPDVPILPVRVTGDDGNATSWTIASGIALATAEGARVINVSFAPLHHDEIVLRQARLAYLAGALVVLAADNSGQEVEGGGSDDALFVGAVDRDGELADFSTYGAFVDLVAPGVSIYTTRLGGEYGSSSGTSLAAPIVTGVAALVWSVNRELSPATVTGVLLGSADDLGESGPDARFGAGRVNARRAVELAAAFVEPRDDTPPTIAIEPPAQDALRGGTRITVQVGEAQDLAEVTLFVDGEPLASDSIAPFAFYLDAGRYAPGPHTIEAVAADIFGNSARAELTLTFAGPADVEAPRVAIVSPSAGATVSGTVTVIADGSDDALLTRAEILVDDEVLATLPVNADETRIAYNWNVSSAGVSAGPHRLAVRFTDTSGNVATDEIVVTVAR